MPPPSHRDVSQWSPLVIQYPRAGQDLCAMAHSVGRSIHWSILIFHLHDSRSIIHQPPPRAISECTFILKIIGTRITETVSLFIITKLLFILILRNHNLALWTQSEINSGVTHHLRTSLIVQAKWILDHSNTGRILRAKKKKPFIASWAFIQTVSKVSYYFIHSSCAFFLWSLFSTDCIESPFKEQYHISHGHIDKLSSQTTNACSLHHHHRTYTMSSPAQNHKNKEREEWTVNVKWYSHLYVHYMDFLGFVLFFLFSWLLACLQHMIQIHFPAIFRRSQYSSNVYKHASLSSVFCNFVKAAGSRLM